METILKTEQLCKYYGTGENQVQAFFHAHFFPLAAIKTLKNFMIILPGNADSLIFYLNPDILETLVSAVNRVYLKADKKQIEIEFEESEDLTATMIPHDEKWICEAFIRLLVSSLSC